MNYRICGHSAIGKSHENNGIKCQDSCKYDNKASIFVAAIADGVSASKHSDIASKKAVDCVVPYCIDNIAENDTQNKILSVIKDAFHKAKSEINQISGYDPKEYHTTLTVAVLIKDNLYYGQIGDSGIVAMHLDNGEFERVTEAQNGEGVGKDRPVYPLDSEEKWSINKYEHKVQALFLATDGVLSHIEPALLENQKYKLNNVYLSWILEKVTSAENDDKALDFLKDEVEKMPPDEVCYDDKTLVVISKNKFENLKKDNDYAYYKYPTEEFWGKLKEEQEAKLYPYRTTKKVKTSENNGKEPCPAPEKQSKTMVSKSSPHTAIQQELKKSPESKQAMNKKNTVAYSNRNTVLFAGIYILLMVVIIILLLVFIK